MAFTKRTWKGRQGTGLNKFSINGATPVTVVNQPDSITEVGDALSAGNLNDLENRIADAFDETASQEEVTNLSNALSATNARVENLEQEHGGYYDVTVKSPYTIPSGKAENWSVNVLRGVTRAKNQLESDWTFTDVNNWAGRYCSVACSSNVATTTVTEAGTERGLMSHSNHSLRYIGGHYYLVSVEINSDVNGNIGISINGSIDAPKIAVSSGTWTRISSILLPPTSVNGRAYFLNASSMSVGQQMKFRNMIVCDLTTYFNGNIPSDAQTITDIQTNYPELLVPSDYGSSLVDTTYEGVKSIGKNLCNPSEFVTGKYVKSADGTEASSGSAHGCTGFMRVKGGESYYFGGMNILNSGNSGAYYDINKNYLGAIANDSDARPFTAPSGCAYVRMNFWSAYWTDPTTQAYFVPNSATHEFTSYTESTLSLPEPVTLRSAGSAADTDELNVEIGGVEKRRQTTRTKEINLGDYTWSLVNDNGTCIRFIATNTECPRCSVSDNNINSFAEGSWNQGVNNTSNITTYNALDIRDDASVRINILKTIFTGTTASEFNTWVSGKKLCYELLEYDVTLLDPIENPYLPTEAGGTISSILTEAVDDSMTLGYINL